MRINIFGVGRSGTKAIQLYITYLLAKKYGYVWLNYEPFRYQTRKLGGGFRRGIEIHQNIPLLLDHDINYWNQQFEKFCIDLVAQHEVVVSKFIRGNGRINIINQYTQPDLSFLVVRDLYEILRSSAKANWCIVSKWEWETLIQEANQLDINITNKSYFADKLYVVALYWYIMNKYALENAKNVIIIGYKQLDMLQKYCWKMIGQTKINIDNPLFHGSNIHNDYIINDVITKSNHGLKETIKNNKNKLLKKILKDFSSQNIGNLVEINQDKNEVSQSINQNPIKTKLEIPFQALFDDLSKEINELFFKRQKEQL